MSLKVRELELLVSARGLGNVRNNSWQVAELTQALDVQVLARVHAETAKAEMEVCIRDLKALVATQGKALEAARVGHLYVSDHCNLSMFGCVKTTEDIC